MDLWHDVPRGKNAPNAFNCIIEIPKGSLNKYELDKETGLIMLDRVSHTAQTYPFDYGFVPQTLWEDGDPLDVMVLTTQPLLPGLLLEVRPVAVIPMVDSGESDYKILAVPTEDPRFDNVQDLSDVNPHTLKEITHFFKHYKELQNKEVSLETAQDAAAARAAFEKSVVLYNEKFGSK